MTPFVQIIVIALLSMTGTAITLFTIDRWILRPFGEQSGGVRALFANPFLKIAAILLLVFIVVADFEGAIAVLVVSTIAATVAGADFVLLLMAIIRGNDTFIQEFFQTERVRHQRAARQSVATLKEATKKRVSEGIEGGNNPRRSQSRATVENIINKVSARDLNILWVDDDPKGNELEVEALRRMNFGVDVRKTNCQAKKAYLQKQYDLIISDIDREPVESKTAGLDLPGILETADPNRPVPPLVYYVHSVLATITDMGHPVVNTPTALVEAIIMTLRLDTGDL